MPSRFKRLLPGIFAAALGCGLAIALVPVADAWRWETCVLITSLVVAVYWLSAPDSGSSLALPRRFDWPFLLLPVYVSLQLVPFPFSLVNILSPARARVAEALGAIMPHSNFVTLSAAPSTTISYLIRIVTYTLVFLTVREITRRARQEWPWLVFLPLLVIGLIEAALGLSQKSPGVDVVGTYANRNHFAGLMEMVLPGTIAGGIALVKGDGFRPPSLVRIFTGLALFLAATTMFLAIVDSQSKMGFVATLFGLFTMGALAVEARLKARRKWLALAALAVIFLGAFLLLPSEQAIKGFGSAAFDDSSGEGRIPIAADTLQLIAAYPLFGSGLGTYGSAFPKYQTAVVDAAFMNAHNDYLQLFAELGLVGFLLLTWCAAPIIIDTFRTATNEPEPTIRYLGLGCFGGMVAIGLHSLTDFNLYVPANAMVLTWIAGIAAGLAATSEPAVPVRATTQQFPLKPLMLALSFGMIAFATGRLMFEAKYRGDPSAEKWFCRFGICDIDSVLTAQSTAQAGNFATAPEALLIEAVRRDPANPERWADLGESFSNHGRNTQAQSSFTNALALGPNVPPLLIRAAEFYQRTGVESHALQLVARALSLTTIYVTPIFDWLASAKVPTEEIITHVLPQGAPVFRTYLRYVMNAGDTSVAEQVWDAASERAYLDDSAAREYVNWLYGRNAYQAAQAWAAYLGDRAQGYLKSNWVFNGDFETEVSPVPFEWSINAADGIEVARDEDTKHSGKYSLRIKLAGTQNLSSVPISQRSVVTPGRYRFDAYLKTQNLTTDQGISLRVSDPVSRLNWTTEPLLGTNDWLRVNRDICVTAQTKLLEINLVRQQSLKFDNKIKGTLWIDSVNLSKVSPTCVS